MIRNEAGDVFSPYAVLSPSSAEFVIGVLQRELEISEDLITSIFDPDTADHELEYQHKIRLALEELGG